jgi:prepilin-type N-terminal cleavage/methylation domain-containing protein
MQTRQMGFTLLEMIVVLVLSGFLLAIVAPNVQRMYDSMATASDRKALISALNRLPLFVQERGLPYTLKKLPDTQLQHDDFTQLFTDKQAELRTEEPIFISAAGFCPFGGAVELEMQGRVYSARLEPPRCQWQ